MHSTVERETKLLTLDQVDELFPALKYATWKTKQKKGAASLGGEIVKCSIPSSTDHNSNLKSQTINLKRCDSFPETHVFDTSDSCENATIVGNTQTPNSTALPPVRPITVSPREDTDHPTPPLQNISERFNDNCTICSQLLEDNDLVRGLQCGHCYHQSCIDAWLTNRRSECPLCKNNCSLERLSSAESQLSSVNSQRNIRRKPILLYLRPFRRQGDQRDNERSRLEQGEP